MAHEVTASRSRADAYPDRAYFRPDRGCKLNPSCLSCPRPVCALDEHHHAQVERHLRLQALARDMSARGLSAPAIAKLLHVSRRTAYRYLSLL